MEFSQRIFQKLATVITAYNLNIVEERSYYLKLQSNYIVIVFIHNELEGSSALLLGGNNEKVHMVEIDNEVLKSFFDSDLKLSQVPVDAFIDNLVLFFGHEASPLLKGDVSLIKKLEEFDSDRSKKYTHVLLERQNLTVADKAWKNGDYKEFIKIIDQFNKDLLPSSYQMKYKIANRKI